MRVKYEGVSKWRVPFGGYMEMMTRVRLHRDLGLRCKSTDVLGVLAVLGLRSQAREPQAIRA